MAALGRHFLKYMAGEDRDPDPVAGDHHLLHIAWNALCAYELQVCGRARDTRTELRSHDQHSRELDAGRAMREAMKARGDYALDNFPDRIKMKVHRWNFMPGDIIMAKLKYSEWIEEDDPNSPVDKYKILLGADTLYGYVPKEEFDIWRDE